jgi:hypothetical protein
VPIDLSMREWTRQSFAGLAWRVLGARPHLRRSVSPLLMLEINVACRNEDDNEERDSPHWQALVMTTGSEKQWSDRCWSPICLNTWAGVGRRFKLCRGCKTANYCSRACQRHAWRHAEAPHCEVCTSLREIHGLNIQAREAGRPTANVGMIRRIMSVNEAKVLSSKMKILSSIKSAAMSESTRMIWDEYALTL